MKNKTKENTYTAINAVGIVANAASLCTPFHSPARAALKGVSAACNLTSAAMLQKEKKVVPALIMTMMALADTAEVIGHFQPMQPRDNLDAVQKAMAKQLEKGLAVMFTCFSGLFQYAAIKDGLDSKEKERRKQKKQVAHLYDTDAQQQKKPWYAIPKVSFAKDTIFRGVNAVGFLANAASLCLPRSSPEHAYCKAVSMGCNFVSYSMLRMKADADKDKKSTSERLQSLAVGVVCELAAFGDVPSAGPAFFDVPVVDNFATRYGIYTDMVSMSVQGLNMYGGIEPQETSVNAILARRATQKRVDQYKP